MATTDYYPPPAFSFSVAVVSGAQSDIDAAFREISGIDPKVEVTEVVEGGVNDYVHRLPGVTKHSNLTLKRGYVTQTSALAEWAAQTVGSTLGSPIQPQALNVNLLGPNAAPLVTWTFENAWPVKWEVGGLDASRNEVLTESLEFAYTTVVRTLHPRSSS